MFNSNFINNYYKYKPCISLSKQYKTPILENQYQNTEIIKDRNLKQSLPWPHTITLGQGTSHNRHPETVAYVQNDHDSKQSFSFLLIKKWSNPDYFQEIMKVQSMNHCVMDSILTFMRSLWKIVAFT